MTMSNNKPPVPLARPAGAPPAGPVPSRKSAIFDAYLARLAARSDAGDDVAQFYADAARYALDTVRAGEAVAVAVFGTPLSPTVVMECAKLVQQNVMSLGLFPADPHADATDEEGAEEDAEESDQEEPALVEHASADGSSYSGPQDDG